MSGNHNHDHGHHDHSHEWDHDGRYESVIGQYEDGDSWWASYFTDLINNSDGIIDIHIAEGTMGHQEIEFINELIDDIEEVIDTEIQIESRKVDSDITIARVLGYEQFDVLTGTDYSHVDGLAFLDEDGDHIFATFNDSEFKTEPVYNEYGDVVDFNTTLSDDTKYVIAHELLHALGLQHPDDNGWNAAYNTDDTLMSYNRTGNFDLTNIDSTALDILWG